MAVNISVELLKKRKLLFSLRVAPLQTIIFKIKQFLYEKIRSYNRKKIIPKLECFIVPPPDNIVLGDNLETEKIKIISKKFKSEKYVFIEDFFSQSSFENICNSFLIY